MKWLLAFASLLSLDAGFALAATSPIAAAIPIEHFTKHDEIGELKISPDGESSALTSGTYGRSVLSFHDIATHKLVAGVRASKGYEIDDFYWVSPTRLDFKHAERMKTALERAGKHPEWMALRGEAHGVYDDETRKQMYERVLAFLDQHLKSVDTAAAR